MPIANSAYRNEIKYSLSEIRAQAIHDRMRSFMKADKYGETYIVSSIYLDSPSLLLLNDADVGKMNRHKIRLRTYGRSPDHRVFLEIKERRNRMIRKYRVAAQTDMLASVLENHHYDREFLANPENNDDWQNMEFFMMRFREIQARPISMVRYERSAYLGIFQPDFRITFDRNIVTYPVDGIGNGAWGTRNIERPLNHGQVVLEVKSGGQLPDWMTCIIKDFNLRQRSFSKYVLCTKQLQSEGAVIMESAL
ncbi:MAG: hypothetical protein COA73_00290 [Candidatus Hydrogenedentota bacterium]|nr:MAG: hypothetical protein COA73_00290 [Candidatus Hydrogenedentota bacterium]